jgi:hypothetical protein
LFLKIKEILKRSNFDDTDDISSNTMAALKAIPQNQFQIVLKGGLGAGIDAWLPKVSTLKATTVIFSNEARSTFTVMSSQTLVSDHVHVYPKIIGMLNC